jgi:ABC-2 type transport system permease protein
VLIAVVDALLGMALGLWVSAFAATEFQAVQFMPAILIPQLLLSGLLVPRDELPPALEVVSDLLPLSYAVDAMKHLSTSAEVTGEFWRNVAVVLAFTVAALVMGAVTLRRRTP